MVKIKNMLFAAGLLLSICESAPMLYAKHHHKQKFILQPAGYRFLSKYKIRLLAHPHTRPLEVDVCVGKFTPFLEYSGTKSADACCRQRNNYTKPVNERVFAGDLAFTIEKKNACILFERDNNRTLKCEVKNLSPMSLWHPALQKMTENIWRYNRDAKRKEELSGLSCLHIPTPFAIRADKHCELDATYVLRSQSKPFSSRSKMLIFTIIKTVVDRYNRILATRAFIWFYPYQDKFRYSLCYNITKSGLSEIARQNIRKRYTFLQKVAKKAAEKTVSLYFKFKQADKKLCKT